jgi:hypothetical protein
LTRVKPSPILVSTARPKGRHSQMDESSEATPWWRIDSEGRTQCHCGARTGRSDHCPCCGCEEWEATCDHVCPAPRAPWEAHVFMHEEMEGAGAS